jgi:S1-C subfamily serine protease
MGKVNWKIVTGGVAIFVLGIAAAWVGPMTSVRPQATLAQPALYDAGTVTSIYDKSSPAIVEIDVVQTSSRGRMVGEGQGSGFLINADGTILTNNHVVEGASKVSVVFNNGKTVSANVIGTDPVHDLALIKVDPTVVSGITPLTLADSTLVKPGQMAIAMGAPYGLDESITVGVISGLNRSVIGSQLTGMLQTDAALNPGNSGGPLLDANGQVIGINTAIEAQPGATGIGFAIPSSVAKSLLPALSSGKPVQPAQTTQKVYMGISGLALNTAIAQQLNLSINQGIYIVNVVSGSPADKAGLKGSGVSQNGTTSPGGDIITAVDGHAVSSVSDISSYISGKQVGDKIALSILRAGSSTNVTLTLGAWPTN